MQDDVREQVRHFPDSPGVYLMKNKNNRIIYVGKAKSLKKRVVSYFNTGKDIKTRFLVHKIHSIEHISTNTEYEALLLENNLIKQWKPHYNINLKDGKTYPVVKITNEPYPRIYRTRTVFEDGGTYFGPFPNVNAIDRYLEIIDKVLPLRKCKGLLKKREHPCLYYHIGRCAAPCCGKISREEYAVRIERIKELLSGKIDGIVQDLTLKMHQAAHDLAFERASELRDTIEGIRELSDEQHVMDFSTESRDYIAYAFMQELCSFCVFKMRGGRLKEQDVIRTQFYGHEDDCVSQFLLRYYEEVKPPQNIYLLYDGDVEQLSSFVRERYGSDLRTVFPGEDKHYATALMVKKNCVQDLDRRAAMAATVYSVKELKTYLTLPSAPDRIEGFDISQLGGRHPVASMVSFYKGKPDKKNYRRFHVKTLDGVVDDYESIREVVSRRYTRLLNENQPMPDLILIDGGKGQLNAAAEILTALGVQVPLIGLAKRLEEIFTWDGRKVMLPETSPALRLLQAVRDEAHRFATDFNKKLREKDVHLSFFENVKGIGPARGKKLLSRFSSLENIGKETPENIAAAVGIPVKLAQNLLQYIKEGF